MRPLFLQPYFPFPEARVSRDTCGAEWECRLTTSSRASLKATVVCSTRTLSEHSARLRQQSAFSPFLSNGYHSLHVLKPNSSFHRVGSTLALKSSTCTKQSPKWKQLHSSFSNELLAFQSQCQEANMFVVKFGYMWKRPGNGFSFKVQAEGGDPNKSWWDRFLFEPFDEEDFLFSDEEDAQESGDSAGQENSWCEDDIDRMLADDASFAAWQQRIKSRSELRESQVQGRDPNSDNWEDWLDDSWRDNSSSDLGGKNSGWYSPTSDWEKGGLPVTPPDLPERGMSRTMKELLFRIFEDEEEVKADLAFEDRVFRFTSQATVKFVAVLIIVPWMVDYISHDFLIVPFLNRYVEKVPLAAELLDLRESQKLNMVEELKMERQRVRFEAAIGKAPPLSDEELMEHIREEAIELRDELRLENRKAFGNIWSDVLAGLTFFLLLVFNPEKVAIMKLTGNRLFTNISDMGKAFLIILLSDIFLGYHSESGWETVVEIILEHYGIEVEKASIYIFVAIVPVTIDACFKLWVFRNLTRISPSATATFKEMKRH